MGRTLYLDVDGVVCPFGPGGTTGWGSAWQHADAGLLPVTFAAELVAGLNYLALTPGLRCVWLTSWEELAPQYLCPAVGIKGSSWPYLAADGAAGGTGWWKLRAIQEDVENTGPDAVAWVDDQLGFEAEAQSWARFLGRRILTVSPHPRQGITPAELDLLRSFLSRSVF
ncbi:HAD domain-containing protein [Arthrobacter sp. SAFR-179]|uniref:HAD domain-containing protein n=1 Tax=Arthrobacter sp. SAFR-179 TaxID=3387279 RepID=UPI003F7B3767